MSEKLIFEKSVPGRRGYTLAESEIPSVDINTGYPDIEWRQNPLKFPELSEADVVRHYTALSGMNHGVDSGFYPLGSCTMKYNPKVNEKVAQLDRFTDIHPLEPEVLCQGTLGVLSDLEAALCEITGMDAFSLQPAAGAHGEYTAMLIVRRYYEERGESRRNQVLIPVSAHGTNPASAAMAGFEVIPVASGDDGLVDLNDLQQKLSPSVAAFMLTNPNTLGLFERNIVQIADEIHRAGGLLYYDGANLNAIMGITRPGDMGFDLMHLNLHKTFATPHGGGGPGAGPVGVKQFLRCYLPGPRVQKTDTGFGLQYDQGKSIGRVHSFCGNFGVLLKALTYIEAMGGTGLTQCSRDAVLNANYLRKALEADFRIPYNRHCMHEFVMSASDFKPKGVRALDIAKRLIDFGVHPPTIYFPSIVDESLMIEPTESEGLEMLDAFIKILRQIKEEIAQSPQFVQSAPHQAAISRADETQAARKPVLRWQ